VKCEYYKNISSFTPLDTAHTDEVHG